VNVGAPDAAAQGTPAPSQEGPAAPAVAQRAAVASYGIHFDLWEHAHLAEIDHRGLYIEFGSPARQKYTYGDWRSGFGSDGRVGDEGVTYANADGSRVYFRAERSEPLVLRMRLKPMGTAVVTPYLNNAALPTAKLSGNQLQDYDVAVPAERVVAGENRLNLRFGSSSTGSSGEVQSAAVASLRIMRAEEAASTLPFQPPRQSRFKGEVAIGSEKRRALVVSAPTTLSYYLDVPEGGKLSFGLAATSDKLQGLRASVTIRAEGTSPKTLFAAEPGATFRDEVIALDDFAGKIVRIDFSAEGDPAQGVAWSSPALVLTPAPVVASAKQAKNIVVVLIDTLRARSLRPFNADTRVQTPVLDAIASEGAVFEATQAPENWTKPSTASLLTGLFPATHGAKTDAAMVPKSALLLPEALKAAGFATGSFIANGYVSDKFGFNQGWDYYTNYIRERKSTDAEYVFKDAADWVEKRKGERFFAYVHTIDPHVPYDPPAEYLKLYKKGEYTGAVSPRKTPDQLAEAKRVPPRMTFNEADKQYLRDLYDGEVSYHDHHLGTFVERLKAMGVYDDTVFVITADHGEEFDEHGSWGHGHSVYQELLWIPYIVRFPGIVPAGKRIHQTVSSMSVYPTVLDAAGVALPAALEDRSKLDWLRGGPPPALPVAFSDFLDDRRVIRAGRYKLILRGLNETFFDLADDPLEQKELDRSKFPVAARYTTLMLGQYLGARDRRTWLKGEQGQGTKLERENAAIDATLREQLKAIGYAGDGPTGDTH
jgi:arylsulfatase A-like enzyme